MDVIDVVNSPTGQVLTSGVVGRPDEHIEVRIVRSPELLDELRRARRETYARRGVVLRDDALDALRALGTTIGVFVDGKLVGAFSAMRLSEAPISLGHRLTQVDIDSHPPDKVVELGSMFVLPEYAGRGLARLLLEAGRVLIAGMRPELVIVFPVPSAADRYLNQFGFHAVGPFAPHPLAPEVTVIPAVATYEDLARVNFI
jgi:GNAT superfamily N-acetyltransferase